MKEVEDETEREAQLEEWLTDKFRKCKHVYFYSSPSQQMTVVVSVEICVHQLKVHFYSQLLHR